MIKTGGGLGTIKGENNQENYDPNDSSNVGNKKQMRKVESSAL